MLKQLALATGLLFFTLSGHSVEMPYFGIDGGLGLFISEDFEDEVVSQGARIKFGSDFNPYFGTEIHFMAGLGDSEATIKTDAGSTDYDLELVGLYSLFFRTNYTIKETVSLYLLGGVSQYKFKTSSDDSVLVGNPLYNTRSISDNSLSFGGGLDLRLGKFSLIKDLYLNADYMVYATESDYVFSVASAGFKKYF